ncbi:MAG: alpha/beta hydrolase family protein [Nevskiaceae bacterium]
MLRYYHTYTGGSQRIARGVSGTYLWFTDRDGYPAFRVDGSYVRARAHIYARKGPGNVPEDELEWEKVDTINFRDEQNESAPDFYPLYAGPEPNTYYVSARPEGADTSGIYLYDFIARKYLKTLATEPGIDIQHMYVDGRTREFLGVTIHADRRIIRLADPKLQAHFNALDKYFGEADVYLDGYDSTMENWLVYAVGPRDRGNWHVYRLKDRYVREVAHYRPAIDLKRLGTTRVVRYQARDGLEIMGYLTTPPMVAKGGKPPLIMLPHGGPEVRTHYQFDGLVQLLASRGYQVFQPNFRGSSGFGKRFADAGKRQWGGAMQDDLTDALAFLVESGRAARDQACILGASYGGYAALAGATLTPDLYRCAVSLAGISDLTKHLRADKRAMRGNSEGWEYVKRQIGDPDDDKAMLEARSPARLAAAVKIPVLLIHGERDARVLIEQSELMEKALRKAGKDLRLLRLEESGHAFDDDEQKVAYRAILEFLDEHLPTGIAAPPASPEPPKEAAK